MTNVTAGYICGIVTRLFSLFGGKITALTAAKLNYKGLCRIASCLDSVTVVKEELEGVGRKRNVTEADYMRLNGKYLCKLLISVTADKTGVNVNLCVILKGKGGLILSLFYVVLDFTNRIVIFGLGCLSERKVTLGAREWECRTWMFLKPPHPSHKR